MPFKKQKYVINSVEKLPHRMKVTQLIYEHPINEMCVGVEMILCYVVPRAAVLCTLDVKVVTVLCSVTWSTCTFNYPVLSDWSGD